jgi:HTH-type transcriptional regulator/antitoxin MqsA
LLGEEIVGLRKRYGLTQLAAARLFGKGKIAFSRYENEATYPDASTTLLLTMAIDMPDSLKWLADKAGVEIPMWRERREDAVAEPSNPKNMPAPRGGLEGA